MRQLILIMAVLVVAGCGRNGSADKTKATKKPATKAVLVELAEVQRGMIEDLLERSAPLEAEAHVQVLARTQNPAIELLVEEGDQVAKGQVLLRLENDSQTTDYDTAMSQLDKAQIEFETQEKLYQQQLISDTEFRDARFALNQAKLASDTARRQLEYTEVVAPIKGTITSRTVKVGDQVVTGNPIFEIIDLESTVAVIHVPEQYLPKMKTNMAARLMSSTYEDQVFSGFVKRISPIVESRSGTVKVTVGVRDLGVLRPGMWVDVELVLDTKQDALLIPKRSIVYDNDQTYAFKVYTDTNGLRRVKRQLVVALNADRQHIEPKEGFDVGDQIVVAGQGGLKEDSQIRELQETETAPQPTEPRPPATNSTKVPPPSKTINTGGG